MHWPIFVTGLESIVCRRPGPGESGAKGIFKKNGIKVMSSQVFISTKAQNGAKAASQPLHQLKKIGILNFCSKSLQNNSSIYTGCPKKGTFRPILKNTIFFFIFEGFSKCNIRPSQLPGPGLARQTTVLFRLCEARDPTSQQFFGDFHYQWF